MRPHLGFEEASNKDATLTKTQSARVKRVTPHNLQRRPKPPITRTALTTKAREHTRPVAYGSVGFIPLSWKFRVHKQRPSESRSAPKNPEHSLYMTLNDECEVDGDNRPDENTAWRQTVKADGWF